MDNKDSNTISKENQGPVIRLEKICKEYRVYQSNKQVIAHELLGIDAGTPQPALTNITFTANRGENIALIGSGSSGKTSLIRILAGIVQPTSGTMSIRGKVTSALTFGAGFDLEMTGRENISLKGMLLDWSKEKIEEEEASLIEFAELGDVIDYKMKTYRPQDIGRLGLAMFTATDADIYVFDCQFIVGDRAMKQKCMKRLKEIAQDPEKTVVLVNNFLPFGNQLCERGIVLDDGKIMFDGKLKAAMAYFRKSMKPKDDDEDEISRKNRGNSSYDPTDSSMSDMDTSDEV